MGALPYFCPFCFRYRCTVQGLKAWLLTITAEQVLLHLEQSLRGKAEIKIKNLVRIKVTMRDRDSG